MNDAELQFLQTLGIDLKGKKLDEETRNKMWQIIEDHPLFQRKGIKDVEAEHNRTFE